MSKFYGYGRDMLTACKFMEKIKQATTIGAWNNTRKCAEFCHLLHSEANRFMSATLKKCRTVNDDWNEHKRLFLKYYNIKGTAKLNFFALHKMKQAPAEKVWDFWTKIQIHCERINDTIDPADIKYKINSLHSRQFFNVFIFTKCLY